MKVLAGKLIEEKDIEKRVKELAAEINSDYEGQEVVFIGVLKGAVVFISDLMRNVTADAKLDFIAVSSYGDSTESSGVVRLLKDLDLTIKDKHVIVVEDIIDTGLTLEYLLHVLMQRHPKSIEICTLLDKPSRRKADIEVKYVGFQIPDEFVVGYGIDYAENYRHLPYVGIIGESDEDSAS